MDKKHKKLYVFDEWYQAGMGDDELVRVCKEFFGNGIVTCDSAEPKTIDYLSLNGINAIPAVEKLLDTDDADFKTGVQIVLKALEEPVRQIARNAGEEGSVIVDKIKNSNKIGYGLNFATNEYCDMIESGIVDPAKVTRSAIQNASSVASMVLTTESLVTDIKDPQADAAQAAALAAAQGGGMY